MLRLEVANVPTVLVADDNTNIQKMVSLALEDHGITVVAVSNGEAAVRKMADLHPDILLADIFMPVRNGYELCEFVKKNPRLSHIPVVLLIGAFDPLDEKEVRRVGANGVLKKPFVPPDPLIAMVTGMIAGIEKRHAQEPAAAAEEKAAEAHPAPIPMQMPVHESEPEEFAIARGSLSLRDEDSETQEAPAPVETAQQSWDETAGDWQRRSALSLEIPAELAPTSFGSEHEAAGERAQESPIPFQPVIKEHEIAPVESDAVSPAAGSSLDWMEMVAASERGFSAEPSDEFVAEATQEAAAPSAVISSEAPPEMLWQPAALAGEQPRAQSETEHEPALSEELAPAYEAPPEEIPYMPEAVVYEPSPYFPAAFLIDPLWAISMAVYPLEELPPEPTPPAPPSAQLNSYPAPPTFDPAAVDAVVARVLERLEPQIRDILSREIVRPLAEALLQRESEKK